MIYRNLDDEPVTFSLVAANVTFEGMPVTLPAGQEFVANQPVAIEDLNLIFFFEGQPFDNGFQFDVPCGLQQVFEDFGFALSFRQEPIP